MLAEAAGIDPETTLNDVHHMISVYPSSKMPLGMQIENWQSPDMTHVDE